MMNTNDGHLEHHEFPVPHISAAGHAICTNPKCKARIMRSNATLHSEPRIFKALMFTNTTKLFVVEGSIIAECACGHKYDVGEVVLGKSSVFFERNRKQ